MPKLFRCHPDPVALPPPGTNRGKRGDGGNGNAVSPVTSVELEGVEPSSKQGTRRLSTCLSVISSFSPYPAYGSPIRSPVRKISPRTPEHAPQPASHCRYPDASRTRSGSCRRGTRPRTSLGTGIKVMLLSKITQRVHSYYCHLYVCALRLTSQPHNARHAYFPTLPAVKTGQPRKDVPSVAYLRQPERTANLRKIFRLSK